MAQKENKAETQIRSLPRGPVRPTVQKTARKKAEAGGKDSSEKKMPRWIIYVGTASAALLIGTLLIPNQKLTSASQPKTVRKTEQASVVATGDAVAKYQQDAEVQHRMMMRRRELENMQLRARVSNDSEAYLTLPDESTANMGVQIDTDRSAERVYDDLNDEVATNVDDGDVTPEERINRRLVRRKWLNETERAERIQVVSNFIKDAHDRGMDVEIDQNLVVVGVKRVNPARKLNINQVIDRLARENQ